VPGIKHNRIVPTTSTFVMPENDLAWASTYHHNGHLMVHARAFADLIKSQ